MSDYFRFRFGILTILSVQLGIYSEVCLRGTLIFLSIILDFSNFRFVSQVHVILFFISISIQVGRPPNTVQDNLVDVVYHD